MNIVTVASPHFTQGRKNYKPEAIVIHVMDGTLSGTDSWFRDARSAVSAHYGIGKNGEIHAYVSETNTAWHAGRVNMPQWTLIKGAGNGLYINPNYYTIGIEHEGSENSEWTSEMYDASAALIKDICMRWNIPVDSRHVIGHRDIFSLKTCPGNKADISKLIALAGGNLQSTGIFATSAFTKIEEKGKVTTKLRMNVRPQPDTVKQPVNVVAPNVQLAYDGYTSEGEKINGNGKWYFTNEGNWFWSGAVSALPAASLTIITETSSGELSLLQVKNATGARTDYAGQFLPYLMEACEKYDINSPARRLCFLSQIGHESGGLFFTEELASGRAYEGRTDLGNVHPGDGIRFKGRGLIQITGRVNYEAIGEDMEEDFLTRPQLLGGKNIKACTPLQLRYAALSAGWFWNKKKLNELADEINIYQSPEDGNNLRYVKEITKKINGGFNGLQDRVTRFITGAQFF